MKNKQIIPFILGLLLLISLIPLPIRAEDQETGNQEITIIGEVRASSQAQQDNINAVEIVEKSNWILFEKEKYVYPIANEGKGRELLGLLQCKVKATGILHKNAEGKETFHVSSYEIIERPKAEEKEQVQPKQQIYDQNFWNARFYIPLSLNAQKLNL